MKISEIFTGKRNIDLDKIKEVTSKAKTISFSYELNLLKQIIRSNQVNIKLLNQELLKLNSENQLVKQINKLKLPPEDEKEYIEEVRNNLLSGSHTGTVQHFIDEIRNYLNHLAQMGDRDLVQKITKSNFFKRVFFYQKELDYLNELHDKLTESGEQKKWEFFRKHFIKQIRPIAHRFEEYGDTSFKNALLNEEEDVHENHQAWLDFMTKKLNELNDNKYLVSSERDATIDIAKILEERIQKIETEEKKVNEEIINLCRQRIKEIRKRKDVIEDSLINYNKKLIQLESLREVIALKYQDIKKHATYIKQSVSWINRLKSEKIIKLEQVKEIYKNIELSMKKIEEINSEISEFQRIAPKAIDQVGQSLGKYEEELYKEA